jgi:hypothetical protein
MPSRRKQRSTVVAAKANKTQPTTRSAEDFLASVTPDARRSDGMAVCEMMTRLSGEQPKMWGPSIVGFGVRHYRYESGREGETVRIGFSPRKEALALYGLGVQDNPLLERLGKHTTGKGCLYIKRLSEVDPSVLEAVIVGALSKGEGG